jgi:hypothetical protein
VLVILFYITVRDVALTLVFAAALPISGIAATELLKK